LRALVVGSGYRVRNAFLPALALLDERVEVVAIHSRKVANARAAGKPWGVGAVADLASVRPADVDLVLMSVTLANNGAVLRECSHLAPGAALVVDTPAISGVAALRHLSLFRQWAQVRVAEDFMNLPQFRLIGRLISEGRLGEVSSVRQTQMGYQYHALALLRSWLGFQPTASARARKVKGGFNISYRFADGATGDVIEPYRKAEGSFHVTGTRASLTGHPMGHPTGGEGPDRLARLEDGDGLYGFHAFGEEIRVSTMGRLRAMNLEDHSEFNLLRVDGLREIVSSLWTDDPVNDRYRLEDAMTDKLVSSAARRYRRVPWTGDVVDRVETAIHRFRPSQV
jgi:predicted dehydrogenase